MSEKNSKGTPTDLSGDAVEKNSSKLRRLLADVFARYVKAKNFHWQMSERPARRAVQANLCAAPGKEPKVNYAENRK